MHYLIHRCIPFAALLLCLSAQVYAQISIGEKVTVSSQILSETRTLYVSLPKSYHTNPDQYYPLYLTLDARAMFAPAATMIGSLSSSGAIPEMIVVSVENTDRWRDLTPVAHQDWSNSGGGEQFLQFIEKELILFVEKNWRVHNYRIFSGHSLGGLMVMHSFFTQPKLFDAYIALSPSMRWSESLLNRWMTLGKSQRRDANPSLYMALANEWEDKAGFNRISEFVTNDKQVDLQVNFFHETDDHHSVRVPATLAAIRWAFSDYQLRPQQFYQLSSLKVNQFYQHASKKYKLKRELDIMQLTNAGYWGLKNPSTQTRALALFEKAVNLWPNDAYAWSCLGEGKSRLGDLKGAHLALKKSLQIGEQSGFGDMDYLNALLASVEKKIRED